jgi:ABC-type dipeptide/oligopeptide/nickel transport system ATPase subunit
MREVVTRARLGPAALRVCLALGLRVQRPRRDAPPERLLLAADTLMPRLARRGVVVCLTGPSGGGKSSLLRELSRRLGVPIAPSPLRSPRAIADRAEPAALARAGLAEGEAMLRRSDELSDGQRHRFTIALAMDSAEPSAPILLDEFGSTLDRLTARSLARAAARWARAEGRTLILASAHDDLIGWIRPDVLVRVPLTGDVEIQQLTTESTETTEEKPGHHQR